MAINLEVVLSILKIKVKNCTAKNERSHGTWYITLRKHCLLKSMPFKTAQVNCTTSYLAYAGIQNYYWDELKIGTCLLLKRVHKCQTKDVY